MTFQELSFIRKTEQGPRLPEEMGVGRPGFVSYKTIRKAWNIAGSS